MTIVDYDPKSGCVTLSSGEVDRLVPSSVAVADATGQLCCAVASCPAQGLVRFGRSAQTSLLWAVHQVGSEYFVEFGEYLARLPKLCPE